MFSAPSILPPIPNFVATGESNLHGGQDGTSMQQQLVLLPYGSQYRQTNLAVDGEDISTTDAQYQARCGVFAVSVAQTPYKCLILGGLNDILQGASAATVIANLLSVYGKATTAGATLFACTMPPANSVDPTILASVDTVNTWIRSNPGNYRFLIDLNTMFPDLSDTLYYLGDKAHFTALAQTLWAQAVNTKLGLL